MSDTHDTNDNQDQRTAVEAGQNARLRQQAAVARLGEYALACTNLDSLFDEAVRSVASALDVEMCKVLQLLPGGDLMLLRSGVGWKPGLVRRATVGTDLDSQAGYTLLAEEPVIVDDLRIESRFSGPALLRDHKVISGMSVLIPGKKRPFGVLGAHSTTLKAFGEWDKYFIQSVAYILALAIQKFEAEEALSKGSAL